MSEQTGVHVHGPAQIEPTPKAWRDPFFAGFLFCAGGTCGGFLALSLIGLAYWLFKQVFA